MFVVPTSRRIAPLTPIISGMRKLPPISMSWPREMTTSFPWHSARKTITVAAALLLTAVADSAPVNWHTHSRMGAWLGYRCSAQISVEHDSRGINDPLQFGLDLVIHPPGHAGRHFLGAAFS